MGELLNNWHPKIRLLYSDLRAAAWGDAIGPPTGFCVRPSLWPVVVASVATPSSSGRPEHRGRRHVLYYSLLI